MADLEFWRNFSIIWLSLLCLVALLIPLVLAYFLVRGMNAALNGIPRLLRRGQGLTHAMHERAETMSVQIAAPVAQVQRQVARAEVFAQRMGLARPEQRATHNRTDHSHHEDEV